MRYLITSKDAEPALTNWFDAENNFSAKAQMVVYDLCTFKYTKNGKDWYDIAEDSL